nr:importin-5-like [Nicotiana tomentosiformis]
MALGEEVLVCSLLEDLIILAGAETEFFTVQIDVIISSMVKVVENLELKERTWQLAIEFVLIVAEDVVSKLLSQLIVMLVHIEDDPNWGNAISDDENAGELSMCSYAMESLGRLAIALGGNVILPSCLEYLFSFLYDENWRIRHAGVTAIGLIFKGCSKALLQEMWQLVETVVMLIHDTHPRVRWATIHAIGQLSKYLSPHFQEQYHQQILSALREVLDDFDNPSFLYDENWRIRHAGVTAIGLIFEGCSKALLQEMWQLVETVVMLIHDTHPRVRWATIHAIGQLSKYLSPHFQEQYHQQILSALREVLDDFDNPRLQGIAYGLLDKSFRRYKAGLQGIGTSAQGEAIDRSTISSMEHKIAKLTAELEETKAREKTRDKQFGTL